MDLNELFNENKEKETDLARQKELADRKLYISKIRASNPVEVIFDSLVKRGSFTFENTSPLSYAPLGLKIKGTYYPVISNRVIFDMTMAQLHAGHKPGNNTPSRHVDYFREDLIEYIKQLMRAKGIENTLYLVIKQRDGFLPHRCNELYCCLLLKQRDGAIPIKI